MQRFLNLAVIAFVVAGYSGTPSGRTDFRPVAVPVVLEGVRYDAGGFNAIKRGLEARFTLHYAIIPEDSETLYAFTSLDAVKSFVKAHSRRSQSGGKLASPISRPLASHGCAGHAHITSSRFFGDANCGGWQGSLSGGQSIANLNDVGNNDQMSSLACAVDSTWTTWCVIYEHANFTGASLWTAYSIYRNNLADFGFNDIASSVIVYGQPT